MSLFNDAIEQGLKSASEVMGEKVTYKGKEVLAIFSEIDTSIDAEIYGDKSESFAEFVMSSKFVRPERGDLIIRQGSKYKAVSVNFADGYYEVRARLQDA